MIILSAPVLKNKTQPTFPKAAWRFLEFDFTDAGSRAAVLAGPHSVRAESAITSGRWKKLLN
jgi:hypothetical protein